MSIPTSFGPLCSWNLTRNEVTDGTFGNQACSPITTSSVRQGEPEGMISSAESVTKSAIILLVVASSLVGNFFITVSYFQNFKMRTVTNTLVLNMSFADEFSSLMDIPFYVVPLLVPQLLQNLVFCEIATFFDGFFKIASILNMSGIALDRHLYLVKTKNESGHRNRRRKQWMTRRRAKIIIVVSWVVAFAASLWTFWDFRSHKNCPRSIDGLFEPSVTLPSIAIFSKVAFIILPTLVICSVLYRLLTLVRRRRQINVVDDASVFSCASAEHSVVRAFARSSITAVILFGMYVICTVPFCGTIIYSICVKAPLISPIPFIFHLLFRLKSALFPLLYVMRNRVILSLVQQKLGCCPTQFRSEASQRDNMAFVVPRPNPMFNWYRHAPAGRTRGCENPAGAAGITDRLKLRVFYSANNNVTVNFDTFMDLESAKADRGASCNTVSHEVGIE